MNKRYVVTLTDEERWSLRTLVSSGKGAARKLTHARILLKADASPGGPDWTDAAISEGVEVGTATVERVRQSAEGVFGHGVLIEAFGFRLSRVSGSHHIYVHPDIRELVNLQNVDGQAKPYQIRQLLRLVERYNLSLEDDV